MIAPRPRAVCHHIFSFILEKMVKLSMSMQEIIMIYLDRHHINGSIEQDESFLFFTHSRQQCPGI
jgi:hypothetical protein